MKRFLKVFFNLVLWFIAILALSTSLFLMTKNIESDANNKTGTTILQLEKRISELEKTNKQLEEEIEYAQYSVENHIHRQYEEYPGRMDEYYFDRNRIRVKPKSITKI